MSQHLIHQNDLPDFNPFPGHYGKLVHGESMTIVHWRIEKGHEAPLHSHPHEQIISMLEGEYELVLNDHPIHMKPGDILVIPGGEPHSGRSLTDCRLIDVWHPCRSDYQYPNP